jgi:hypothetical protein
MENFLARQRQQKLATFDSAESIINFLQMLFIQSRGHGQGGFKPFKTKKIIGK